MNTFDAARDFSLPAALIISCALVSACGNRAAVAVATTPPAPTTPPPAESGKTVVAVAHRGYSGIAPENTLSAVQAGIDFGAEWVEIDVLSTADNQIVVIHDTNLRRTTDVEEKFPCTRAPTRCVTYSVGEFTLEEMRELDAGSWFSADFIGEPLPTLAEVLALFDGTSAGLLLEIKSPEEDSELVSLVATELEAQGWVVDGSAVRALIVQSFDAPSVAQYKGLHPNVEVGVLQSSPPTAAEAAEWATYAEYGNFSHSSASAEHVQNVQDAGMGTMLYTINDSENMQKVLGWGVDGVITNEVELFLQERAAFGR